MRILLLILLASTACYSQITVYVKDSTSSFLTQNKQEWKKYNEFKKKYDKLYKEHDYVDEDSKYYYFSEDACWCSDDIELLKVSKPTITVKYDRPIKPIRDTVIAIKWKTKTLRDTIPFVIRDTVLLSTPCLTVADTVRKTWFTTTDHTTMLIPDSTGKSMIPYIERRYYDYDGKMIEKLKIDPVTLKPITR